ncbi:uncharacterized protein [Asterias amurensis]|uniref:uncharacterized protein n=1 Tax=Asterias amurensis TaxID=7602 RepID=UPI003AB7D670
MKVIILAGGYGTRLQKDLLENDPNQDYHHLLGMPKALLPVGSLPLISHWMKSLQECKADLDDIVVVSNKFYEARFKEWCKDWPEVKLICDGTSTNETRLGAIACIELAVDHLGHQDDIIVIGGDTLFLDDFNLSSVIQEFKRRLETQPDANLVLACPCSEKDTVKVGILETDSDCRVTAFLEKPKPEDTSSRNSCPCFYIFSRESLPLIRQFLEEKKDGPLKDRDATGHFVKYLFSRLPVYIFNVSARFDVGALASYIPCHQFFLQRHLSQNKHEKSCNREKVIMEGGMNKSGSERLPATYVPGFHNKDAVKRMQYNQLGNTGMEVSVIGLGGYPFGNIAMSLETSLSVVNKALQSGINYIDTAPWYGNGVSETTLGKVLKDIPRETYYIATKVGRYSPEVQDMFDFSAEKTLQSVDESLNLLGLDYVDIIQVHDLEFAPNIDIVLNECLPALEKVKKAGKARFIGITGYPMEIYRKVLERSSVHIDTALSYCRLTMLDTSLLKLLPYLKEKNVGIINAAPIGMGLLTNKGPPLWHPASTDIRNACQNAALYCQSKDINISRLAVHYSLSQNAADITVIGMDSVDIIDVNLQTLNESLTEAEQETMDYVIDRFFNPLETHHWEGIEVKKYWGQLKELEKAS